MPRFSGSFSVTRSDTGGPLVTGKMVCDPRGAVNLVPPAESRDTTAAGDACDADAFGTTFWVAFALRATALVSALLLPAKSE